jgi:NADPH-dependent 2,4-dienoyl-CoA reductase/sulfur reductase-like enzyme/rhodanese-related sulfurtransferase
VDLRNVATGAVTTESYDKLVLSPGALSVRPPLPGIDLSGIFQARTVPNARQIRAWIEKGTTFLAGMYNYSGIQMVKPTRRAVVIGGGFIGLETAENLVHIGFEVTLVELADQVLAPLDREHARLVEGHLTRHGVHLALSDGGAGFRPLDGGAIEVQTQSGKAYPTDMSAGRDSRFRGTQGTAIIGLFGTAAAWTGASEKTLEKLGDGDYEKIYLFPNSHAGYYPGAKMIGLKVLFRKSDGRLLGAQALGEDGPAVDKRISALAVAIQMGATVYDLEEAELCYAPPFGSAKDPVNFAGMVAADVLRGDMPLTHWQSVDNGFILDVRDPPELAVEQVSGALNIPFTELCDREILVFCRSGQRAYYVTRILQQNGFRARNVARDMLSRSHAVSSRVASPK